MCVAIFVFLKQPPRIKYIRWHLAYAPARCVNCTAFARGVGAPLRALEVPPGPARLGCQLGRQLGPQLWHYSFGREKRYLARTRGGKGKSWGAIARTGGQRHALGSSPRCPCQREGHELGSISQCPVLWEGHELDTDARAGGQGKSWGVQRDSNHYRPALCLG